jgi:hypothetical protein
MKISRKPTPPPRPTAPSRAWPDYAHCCQLAGSILHVSCAPPGDSDYGQHVVRFDELHDDVVGYRGDLAFGHGVDLDTGDYSLGSSA